MTYSYSLLSKSTVSYVHTFFMVGNRVHCHQSSEDSIAMHCNHISLLT